MQCYRNSQFRGHEHFSCVCQLNRPSTPSCPGPGHNPRPHPAPFVCHPAPPFQPLPAPAPPRSWEVQHALPLSWCSGHMHSATFALPADWQTLHAKLVLVQGQGFDTVSWEPGHDRCVHVAPAGAGSAGAWGRGGERGQRQGVARGGGRRVRGQGRKMTQRG